MSGLFEVNRENIFSAINMNIREFQTFPGRKKKTTQNNQPFLKIKKRNPQSFLRFLYKGRGQDFPLDCLGEAKD